ncbi:S8 family serine peptidase [Hyphomicrobium sp. LHD-15]|uniref:S8 family serine peptidase n=1 Tax=Hyphomicrobium sp. LHD-15 TaxID=3072142 RepID=UPI00280EC60D|nr:S8 family serine peptidase [Hyphomicrobium sp. LHD-15]MDQ8700271.1 S8 family serine peptidase [Hyphomicrobium sp. LHD-15]
MSSVTANSASALNDDAWAITNHIGPLYRTLPDPLTGLLPDPNSSSTYFPGDPLFADQWHFEWLGDIQTIWDEYSGAGVNVGIYDNGTQANHPDLIDNYDASLEVEVDGVTIPQVAGDHGTAVAGLIAAANNGIGTTGVAWSASITGVEMLNYGPADINIHFEGFLQAVHQTKNFDITSNSWGKFPSYSQASQSDDNAILDAYFEAVVEGRDGLGTIIVKAAGNDNRDSNGDMLDVTRATIIVGAYADDGNASWYSSWGANLLVSAPSSGTTGVNARLVTTDVTGGFGYGSGDYTSIGSDGFGGTSGATPIVSGVVALMLSANPNLGWRDVQNVLAYSAREVGSGVGGVPTANEEHAWFYNGADNWNGGGLHFSVDYGFGSVDAYNAVRMAEVWHLFDGPKASANETTLEQSTGAAIALADKKVTEVKFDFSNTDFLVEFVELKLNLTHSSLYDLVIELVSPDGTVVSALDVPPEVSTTAANGVEWIARFGANAFRGENGAGNWTLRITDNWAEDSGTLNSATLSLNGTDGASADLTRDVYHYTNEIFTTLARDSSRLTLSDADGGTDWLDMSAMTGNLNVKLAAGATSTTGGAAFLKIATGTDIENVVTGDGDDRITGNALDNRLYGMRGNDIIDGGVGADVLSGGAGNDRLTGGTGADAFLFDRALNALTNVDIIADFSHIDDTIWLDSSIFSTLSLGPLSADLFYVIGTGSETALSRIVYDAESGALFYDIDGGGLGAAIQFATLSNRPADLSYNDFLIVDTSNSAVTSVTDRTISPAIAVDTHDPSVVYGDGLVPIYGTERDDAIAGKSSNDTIFGRGGNDLIRGGAGNDFIDGGAGFDKIWGGTGNDEIWGGGSPSLLGDEIRGENGDDILHGSDQANGVAWVILGALGDIISGGNGNDVIYGYGGDDFLYGDNNSDQLFGGDGNDELYGGTGNDRLDGGLGHNLIVGNAGYDVAAFAGNFNDYRITGFADGDRDSILIERISGLASGEFETHVVRADIEVLEFQDQIIELDVNPLVLVIENDWLIKDPVTVDINGYEIGVVINSASDVTITDHGYESATEDRLQFVSLDGVTGNVLIQSDALTNIELANMVKRPDDEMQSFVGSVAIDAAVGERTLRIDTLGIELGEGQRITDNTATSIVLSLGDRDHMNGAAVNDYNLSFESATSVRIVRSYAAEIKWFIPNVTTIDASAVLDENGVVINDGNWGTLYLDTPLDDSVLAPAGGSEEFRFIGGGKEIVSFGNLGAVNASNDGTEGYDQFLNAGRGLKGVLTLNDGDDEVRILGTDAFQGGTVDAGETLGFENDLDVIRMSFGVAAAIGDISAYISQFETIQLDMPVLTGQTVDVARFDNIQRVVVTGADAATGDNTIIGLEDGAEVILRSISLATPTSYEGNFYSLFSSFGNNFGTVHLDVAEGSTLKLGFVGIYSDGSDAGTIHVRGATSVNIGTDAIDQELITPDGSFPASEPTDPFNQVLVFDDATTITLSGDTGWDFTIVGTDIGNVVTLDASGVTTTGAVGAVKASAQTTSAVTFTGGMGDDALTGNVGDDTLAGGAGGNDLLDGGGGRDTAIFSGLSSDYAISDNGDGSYTVAGPDGSSDTLRNIELLRFDNGLYNIDFELLEAPTDILPDDASIAENSAAGTLVAELSAVDPNSGDTFTFALLDDAGGRFEIVDGNKLVVKDPTGLDYEAATSHTVTVQVTDSSGLSLDQVLSIAVTDFDENTAPTVSLANTLLSIAENTSTASRVKVADIVLTDDGLGTNRLSLVGRDRALFEIVGLALFLKAGAALNAAQAASLEVAVAVDDDALPGSPDATSATFRLAVADVQGLKMIHGTEASQTLSGTSGNDWIDGHGGADTMRGGKGNDIYVVDSIDDKVIESRSQGTDKVLSSVNYSLGSNVENLTLTGDGAINGTGNSYNNVINGNNAANVLKGGSGNDKLYGHGGNDTLLGESGNDTLYGGDGLDFLFGGTGNDTLYGEVGNDTLYGDSGNDVLAGGLGTDHLYGGAGRDRFDFNDALESAVGSARDIIFDFVRGQDKIDVASFDTNPAKKGDQAFKWIGTQDFHGASGELRFSDLGSEVIVQGDVNGDKHADFEILVKVGTLSSSDFYL